jgi:hypothetical protein
MSLLFDHGIPSPYNIRANNLTVDGTITGGGVGPVTGSWTPALAFNGSSGITYSTPPTGTYTQIGNLVFISGQIQLNNKGIFADDSIPTILGLPVPVGATSVVTTFFCAASNITYNSGYVNSCMHSIPSSSTLSLTQTSSINSGEIDLYYMFMTDTSQFFFSGYYFSN